MEVAIALSRGVDGAPVAPGLAAAFSRALARCPNLSREAREGRAGSLPFVVERGKIVAGEPRDPPATCALDAMAGMDLAGAPDGLRVIALFRPLARR